MALEDVDPQAVEIEYVLSKDLKDVEDLTASLSTLEDRLDSKDWFVVCEALNNVRQLCKFHAAAITPRLGEVVALTLKALKNPRSALIKTSLMTIVDLFTALGDRMLDNLDALLLQLLLKASQDKKFVAEEAEKALFSMAYSITPTPLLQKLQPYASHKNPKVRAKVAVSVHNAVSRLGKDGMQEYGIPSLLKLAGGQVSDQLPEAREAARKLALEIHSAFEDIRGGSALSPEEKDAAKEAWEQLCRSQLSVSNAQSILRITAC